METKEIIINQNSNDLSKLDENSLKKTVSSNLARIAGLKCLDLPKETYSIWCDQIQKDIISGDIVNLERGFKNLLRSKSYGGLDYYEFLAGAMMTDKEKIDKIRKIAEVIINE